MSHAKVESAESLVAVARAVKVRGLKGEIVSELLTDFPERFEGLEQLVALSPDGEQQIVKLESYWFHQQRVVLKFAGFDSVDVARTLIGWEFAVPEAERVLLPEDYFYHWELEGCGVKTVVGSDIGNVREVMRTGGGELLVIRDNAGKDHLVPMVASIIVEIDISRKSIVIDPPEGLLEL